jgi:hypothetical protein
LKFTVVVRTPDAAALTSSVRLSQLAAPVCADTWLPKTSISNHDIAIGMNRPGIDITHLLIAMLAM